LRCVNTIHFFAFFSLRFFSVRQTVQKNGHYIWGEKHRRPIEGISRNYFESLLRSLLIKRISKKDYWTQMIRKYMYSKRRLIQSLVNVISRTSKSPFIEDCYIKLGGVVKVNIYEVDTKIELYDNTFLLGL